MRQDFPKREVFFILSMSPRLPIPAEGLVQVELSLIHQLHQSRQGARDFGDRGQIVQIVQSHGLNAVVGVKTIGFVENNGIVLGHQELRSGKSQAIDAHFHDGIHLLVDESLIEP